MRALSDDAFVPQVGGEGGSLGVWWRGLRGGIGGGDFGGGAQFQAARAPACRLASQKDVVLGTHHTMTDCLPDQHLECVCGTGWLFGAIGCCTLE